jgi:hybrid cluster-associated redox disulfide protein
MVEPFPIDIQSTVSDILERWPETAAVFHTAKTACLGCVMAPFCTVEAVASIYQLDLEQLLADLQVAIRETEAGGEDAVRLSNRPVTIQVPGTSLE